jgi:hypothetical protein
MMKDNPAILPQLNGSDMGPGVRDDVLRNHAPSAAKIGVAKSG